MPVPLLWASELNVYLLIVASKDMKENVLSGGKQGYKGECIIGWWTVGLGSGVEKRLGNSSILYR